ncbi:MAG: hypothetical protein N2745_04495 [Syntrophorhabdaceae bacterium]|nr:hypothetical protein [Syntrophorhabdaceae bacterium]
MDILASGELTGIIEVLKRMAMFEMNIAELYSVCAGTHGFDGEFWLDIWHDEIAHAQYINRTIELISKKPDNFEKGRPFNVFALETVIKDIREKIQMTKNGGLSEEKLLYIAKDYENSYLEDRYVEIVKTENIEFKTLMRRIADETRRHKEKLLRKIGEKEKKAL